MATMADDTDFYEDDEPVERIVAAFEQGDKDVTIPPAGRTEYLRIGPGPYFPQVNEAAGHAVAS